MGLPQVARSMPRSVAEHSLSSSSRSLTDKACKLVNVIEWLKQPHAYVRLKDAKVLLTQVMKMKVWVFWKFFILFLIYLFILYLFSSFFSSVNLKPSL